MGKGYKDGDNIVKNDNLLDGITYDEVITTVHCNCKEITAGAVRNEIVQIVKMRFDDMMYSMEKNMESIIKEAKKGRGQYE